MTIRRAIQATLLLTAGLAMPASARQVSLDVGLDTPVLLEEARTAHLRVALKGSELERQERPPVNLAIVLDRSGSMQGEKLQEAKQAAILALAYLGPADIVSVVTYDSNVDVLVPATKMYEPESIAARIREIRPGGSTALFGGVSKGAAELRKFGDLEYVNRVILLSDGLANVGPRTPQDLGTLGAGLAKEGISVTTVGLGLDYNETLMTRLAAESDGNHYFAERASDLEQAYRTELGELTSVIAKGVDVKIGFAEGVRPLRILGRDAVLSDRWVTGRLNQLYARQTKYFLIEVELPAGKSGEAVEVCDVTVTYDNLLTRARERLTRELSARFTDRREEVDAALNPKVMGSVARQRGALSNQRAMKLRDEGKIEESREVLLENAGYLRDRAERLGNRHLAKDAAQNELDARNLDDEEWKKQRKKMESSQLEQLRSLGYIE